MTNLFISLKAIIEHPTIETFLGITWFDKDFYKLITLLTINLIFLTIIIRVLYYPKTKRKDYLFTYYLIGIITFFLCFALKKLEIDTGMGLGLFAIFGIIRYRTDAIEIKEMTYLFLIIGISVVNALANTKLSIAEMALINTVVIVLTYTIENIFLMKHETRKTVTYDRIDLIKPVHYEEMKKDIEERTGLKISRFEIGKIDFLRDVCQVFMFYYITEQSVSDYSSNADMVD